MKQQFNLDGHPYIALCDLLKLTGLVESGGRAKQLIRQVETRKTAKIIAGDCIQFGEQQIIIINETA